MNETNTFIAGLSFICGILVTGFAIFIIADPISKELLIKNRLGLFHGKFSTNSIVPYAKGLSHGEITQACDDAIKETILYDKKSVTKTLLIQMLEDRFLAYGSK